MVEMHVFGLALDEDSQVPLLILKDKEEKYVLPIWIGAMEAMSISMTLNNVQLPRPLTHDLMLQSFKALGVQMVNVAVVDLREGTYYAEITLTQGKENYLVDSRPSDAIALALRAKAPILANEAVLDQVAANRKKDQQPVIKTDDAEQWTKLLESFDEEDSKYKM